ncbi:MAG: copper chaperone PCu(A)C [Pseudomonadota bacterium]
MKFLAPLALSMSALVTPALADIAIEDPYMRSASPNSPAGAAFMTIINEGEQPDRLIAAKAAFAKKVELHTHKLVDDVVQMVEVEGGFAIPAGTSYDLKRGGDHIMFMGLTEPVEDDAMLNVTLVFENAGEVEIEIPVDRSR